MKNSKLDLTDWIVNDAFENLKSCKNEADKISQRFAKEEKGERRELNAGFFVVLDPKKQHGKENKGTWLCLPAGTNPGIVTRNWMTKDSQ